LFGAAAPTDRAMTTPEPTHPSLVVSRMTLTQSVLTVRSDRSPGFRAQERTGHPDFGSRK
jgi:hypothetical protein